MTEESNNETLVLKTKELIKKEALEEIAKYLLMDEQDPNDQVFIDIPTLVNKTPIKLLAPLLNLIMSSKLFSHNNEIDKALAHFVPR
jgi:SUMO ligase MMS21 Smc5/6 complex component